MLVQQIIEKKLQAHFAPEHLEVINESSGHNVPVGSETHFKVVIVSEVFASLLKVRRQQAVYKALSDELAGGVHALTMQTFSPSEWAAAPSIQSSPPCMGGSKSS